MIKQKITGQIFTEQIITEQKLKKKTAIAYGLQRQGIRKQRLQTQYPLIIINNSKNTKERWD